MSQGRIAVRKQTGASNTLPEIGKIKIGMKHPDKNYPMSLDYFRATGNFAKAFTDINGDKPVMIPICFVSDSLEEVCNERYECWDKGKRWGFGDGTTFTVWNKEAAGGKGSYEQAGPDSPLVKSLKWDQMLTLRFVVLNMPGILGYWSFTSKGKAVTIPQVVKAFDFVKERAGTVVGFPFSLMVEKKVGYNPGEPRNYPVVTLVPNFTQEAIEMVSNYLEQGGNINKITTAMISQQKVLQIEAPKNGGE